MMTQFQMFHYQRHAVVCLVEEIDGGDYVAFWGGSLISIFYLYEAGGLELFEEIDYSPGIKNADHAESLAREHIQNFVNEMTDGALEDFHVSE